MQTCGHRMVKTVNFFCLFIDVHNFLKNCPKAMLALLSQCFHNYHNTILSQDIVVISITTRYCHYFQNKIVNIITTRSCHHYHNTNLSLLSQHNIVTIITTQCCHYYHNTKLSLLSQHNVFTIIPTQYCRYYHNMILSLISQCFITIEQTV